jgi:hypothetical protein
MYWNGEILFFWFLTIVICHLKALFHLKDHKHNILLLQAEILL